MGSAGESAWGAPHLKKFVGVLDSVIGKKEAAMASNDSMKFITALDLGGGEKVRTARLPDEIRNKIKGVVESDTLKLKKHPIVVFNEVCYPKRLIAFYSDESYGYFFSNAVTKSEELTPELTELLEFVNDAMGTEYNGILINSYEDGNDSISAHADNEKALILDEVGAVAINFGATRHMHFTTTNPADPCQLGKKCRIELMGGHLMQMKGINFQTRFKHAIRAEKGAGRRVSFTFRKHDLEKEKSSISKVPAMEARIAKLMAKKEAAAAAEPAPKRVKSE